MPRMVEGGFTFAGKCAYLGRANNTFGCYRRSNRSDVPPGRGGCKEGCADGDWRGNLLNEIVSVAAESDLFIVGETIGSREIPELATELLDPLWEIGYRTLAVELHAFEVEALHEWAAGKRPSPPTSFAHPLPNGSASEQCLLCFREAIRRGWRPLGIDGTVVQPLWGNRLAIGKQHELALAESLLDQWEPESTGSRLFCLVGSIHSRLARTRSHGRFPWPSFAAGVKRRRPELRINSVFVRFHGGTTFNNGPRRIRSSALRGPRFSHRMHFGHPYCLHLVSATPATFAGPFVVRPGINLRARRSRLARELHTLFLAEQSEWERLRAQMGADEFGAQGRRHMEPIFRKNTERLKGLIARYGWPTISLAGPEGAQAASHIAFESGHDVQFQRDCLRHLEQGIADGDVNPGDFARLEDFLLVTEGKSQRYGTQLEVDDGVVVPKPIEEEQSVDERREAFGLSPLSEYLHWNEALRGRT